MSGRYSSTHAMGALAAAALAWPTVAAADAMENALGFRQDDPARAGALTFGLPVQAPGKPPAGQAQVVSPPGRIGTPMSGNVPLQKWKAVGPSDEFADATPSIELDSRLTFALFDSPDAFFFDNLQFFNRVRLGLESPGAGVFQVDVVDRLNVARELLSRDLPPHVPEIHRLFWQWSAPGGAVGTTIGRQRLAASGNRTLGSVSWLPDLQVFDGVRLDAGKESTVGRWTIGAFVDQAMISPFFAGPESGGDPVLLAACSWKSPVLGHWRPHLLAPLDGSGAAWWGVEWKLPGPRHSRPLSHRMEFHAQTSAGNGPGLSPDPDGLPPWHLSWHRESRFRTWHVGAEKIDDGSDGRRISATPGTFRYLSGGPDEDVLNFFIGFDHRIQEGTLASLTYQHLIDENSGHRAGDVIEAAIRHQIAPSAAFVAGAGCGVEEATGEVFLRTGFQLTAAF